MTDKVQKICEEVERLKVWNNNVRNSTRHMTLQEEDFNRGKHSSYLEILNFIDSLQEEPVSEELEEAALMHFKDVMEYEIKTGHKMAHMTSFKAGAQWQKEHFEKNRLKHCNSITNEQAELEQGFIDQHLDKSKRIPTFLDAIEYGMNLQKEQMIKNAVDGVVAASAGGDGWVNIATGFVKSEDVNVKFGDKIKIIVVKED